ncbi:translocation/assembly module TamB domain-containing protein [Opitutus sp. ER46]|uniref:translocation/assembly module TamB domain-containing protein n=1 Tax=Opitutus sp. ER46 TaxID=2161864 RepID=UPI000D4D8DB4|nr:translocation/assembly module TamB domain-containing protein [Opitutus sp. ER46]PTX90857.1 hypothetical protein DB354_19595 [Opitutus sp. ER46]
MRRRRSLPVLAVAGALLLLTALTLPWWLGLVLPPLAGRFGAKVGAYERQGYGRFVLREIEYRRDGVVVRVDHVEAPTPLLWGWRQLTNSPSVLAVGAWSVDVAARPQRPPTPSANGWMPLRIRLQRIARELDRWVPEARTGAGVVRWPRGEIKARSARWQDGTLTVTALEYRGIVVDAHATFGRETDQIWLVAENVAEQRALRLESEGACVTGVVQAWNQTAQLTARFSAQGWLPPDASASIENLDVEGRVLKLGQYARVTGHARVNWRLDHFLTDLALRGAPPPGSETPPMEVTLSGNGTPEAFTLAALRATLPGLEAELTAPVTFERSGRMRESSARFAVHADLARLPWATAEGMVEGEARVVDADQGPPAVEFSFGADNLRVPELAVRRLRLLGRVDWPRLNVRELQLVDSAGGELRAAGEWNFARKEFRGVTAAGEIAYETVRPWLPTGVRFTRASLTATLEGAVTALRHEGRLSVAELQAGQLKPAALQITWRGAGAKIEDCAAEAKMGEAMLTVRGAVNPDEARLTALAWIVDGRTELQLAQPARVTWRPALAVDTLRLEGPQASLLARLTGTARRDLEFGVHGFQSAWLARVVELKGPVWTVPSLALTGSWENGPLVYSLAGRLEFALSPERQAAITLSAKGDAEGLWVQALHAQESGHAVVNASGRAPVTIHPDRRPMVAINPEGPVALEAVTVPNAAFWQQLAKLTGVELQTPEAAARISGTWRAPQGNVSFRASRAAMDARRFARPLPALADVDVAMKADNDGILLERCSFRVEGQLVRASGRLPLPRRAWNELRAEPLDYLRRGAEARLEVPEAEVAKLARFLPAALAPVGRVEADVRFDRGALGGFVHLREAASRPLGPLGVLQQVNADVAFSDQRVTLREVTAMAGGQPVVLSGTVELPTLGGRGPVVQPRYDVRLRGENLPFVRRSGLLLRGDLDLRLRTPDAGAPIINGRVVLRDSLFLTDIRAYLPQGGGASPARRPPYFSVETVPLNGWRLDLDVSGNRFLRIRMPVFAGLASVRFHLGGTLGEPRAIGDATLDEGQVLMPFASFAVRQGAVRLTEENPYEAQIFLRGATRHWGYDLTMEVDGKASAPNIQFSSSPALDSEQVLLMVMTGTPPSNELNPSLRQRAVQIGAFFGQSILGSLGGGSGEPGRLSIETGSRISRQGRETYEIEYQLSDRWTATGEYDEFDEYNAGLKWRVAPRKKQK